MEYIVADENGGQGLVETITDPQSLPGAFISFVSYGAQTNLADGGKGRLRAGTVSGTQ
jgi:hypothetical protein